MKIFLTLIILVSYPSTTCYSPATPPLSPDTHVWKCRVVTGYHPIGRQSHCAVSIGCNVLFFGGYNSITIQHFGDVFALNTGMTTTSSQSVFPYINAAHIFCYLPARTKHTCCTCAAHKTHSFCMCAAYRKIETAPHMCHTQADEVCTHLSKVCTMCAMVMCSMHAVAHVLEAYMLHMKQLHTLCMHAHLVLDVTYMWHVSNMCSKVTGMYAACMEHVCCMYAACMLYVCSMYGACMLYTCLICAAT